MRILLVNSVYGFGSTGRICKDIAMQARSQGHQSAVLYGRGGAVDKEFCVTSMFGFFWHILQTRLADRHGLASHFATRKALARIRSYKPDLVHLHNLHGYWLHVPNFLAGLARLGVPVVITLHDCWTFTGHCAHFEYVSCDRWLENCGCCPQLSEYPASFVADRSIRNLKDKRTAFALLSNLTIVTPSQWLAGKVERSHLGQRECLVINNGIDLQIFRPEGTRVISGAWPETASFRLLAAASIWNHRKGGADLLALMDCLSPDFFLVVIGRQPKKTIPHPRIRYLERVEDIHEMASLYRTADIFINTTLEDTFPTTNLEALACGTPVITYRTGGSPEAIDKNTGIVVEKHDTIAMAVAVQTIKDQGKSYYSANCVQRAQGLYDRLAAQAAYFDLYEKVIKRL